MKHNHAEHESNKDHDHKHDHKHSESGHSHAGSFLGEQSELIFAVLSGVLLVIGWAFDKFNLFLLAVKPIYIASYFFGGYFAVIETFETLKQKKLKIDSLMVLAAAGAAYLGEWPEGALLLTLFSLGHALEHYAMGRAKKAIEALSEIAPDKALVNRDGEFVEVPVSELKVGDIVLVKPNERIAADGYVIKGESAVDQSAVTGESIPVDKQAVSASASEKDKLNANSRVFSGTINGSGTLEIKVSRISSESTLSKVIQMVSEAETKKSPTQLFTDRFEKIFVPAVLILVVILPFAYLVISETWQASLYRALAVLVAASPCALAIATPSAVLSAVARAARGGVLVKGGAPLEELGMLTAIAFDKTGTLTEGRPKVTDVIPFIKVDKGDFISLAVAVETMSDHPFAAAVVSYGLEQKDFVLNKSIQVENIESLTGLGIKAKQNGAVVLIGKRKLFEKFDGLTKEVSDVVESLEKQGRTVMIVKRGSQFLGALGLMDTPRKSAAMVIQELKSIGIRKMIMLSGDNQSVATAVATELGLTDARGDLMPEDKVSVIKEFRTREKIAMIGDGVNDAPAMVQSNVAIAMGAAGSDVALQAADIALMADDLSALPFAVGLSRQTRRIVKQNLWVSLGMVALLVPATIFGLKMGIAVIFHEGSTLLVVFNALRLLGFKKSVYAA